MKDIPRVSGKSLWLSSGYLGLLGPPALPPETKVPPASAGAPLACTAILTCLRSLSSSPRPAAPERLWPWASGLGFWCDCFRQKKGKFASCFCSFVVLELNPDACACEASTLPPELHPQPFCSILFLREGLITHCLCLG